MELLFLAQNVRLLAGREPREGRRLLHGELPVRRAATGPSFGSPPASPAAQSMDFCGFTASEKGHLFMPGQSFYVFAFTWGGPDGYQSSGGRPGYRAPMSSAAEGPC